MEREGTSPQGHGKWPLYLRVTLGASLGIALGITLGPEPILGGIGLTSLAEVGMLVVRALKLVATPLIFFSVLDAVLSSEVHPRSAWRLFAISGVNAGAAIFIALGCAHFLDTGRGAFPGLGSFSGPPKPMETVAAHGAIWLPESMVEPFRQNSALGVALLAVALAVALRVVRHRGVEEQRVVELVATLARAGQLSCITMLGWLIELIPFAVAGVLASAVAHTGFSALRSLATFTGTMLLGLALQVFVYYGLLTALVARRSPLAVLRGMADALLTALSCGSSVATLPVTLNCLDRLGVRRSASRLAAVAGTNLNHDGIILYEAAATVFVAHALGMHPSLGEQLAIAGAAVLAGIGMAGVPEAGLVTLPLVLAAGGIPAEVIPAVLPLLLPVDWIIGRCRAATNVASDAMCSILLDLSGAPGVPEKSSATAHFLESHGTRDGALEGGCAEEAHPLTPAGP